MNKKKTWIILLLLMLLINIVLVTIMFTKKHRHESHKEPKEIIIHKLSFDETQIKEYELLIMDHRAKISEFPHMIHESKQGLYALLRNEDYSKVDSMISVLGADQIEIEKTHFNHFKSLKKLCKPEQMKAFDELTIELEAIFSNKPLRPQRKL